MADHKPVEHHSDAGKVLLDARLPASADAKRHVFRCAMRARVSYSEIAGAAPMRKAQLKTLPAAATGHPAPTGPLAAVWTLLSVTWHNRFLSHFRST